jgi:hypothetical protein
LYWRIRAQDIGYDYGAGSRQSADYADLRRLYLLPPRPAFNLICVICVICGLYFRPFKSSAPSGAKILDLIYKMRLLKQSNAWTVE